MPVHLDDIVTGLQMLGGVLSMPRRVEAEEQQNAIERPLLAGTGMSQGDIEAATPQPHMRWLSPAQGGFTGKVLGGVGDVGSVLSTIVGKPLPSPRASLAELAESTKMRTAFSQQQAKNRLVSILKDPNAKRSDVLAAAAEAGSTDAVIRAYGALGAGPKPPGSAFATRVRMQQLDPNSDEYKQYKQALDDDAAAREKAAEDAADRALKRYKDEHPNYALTPADRQRQIDTEKAAARERFIQQHNLQGDDADYYRTNGRLPPQKKSVNPSLAEITKDVEADMQRERPRRAIDPVERQRRINEKIDFYEGQSGVPVPGGPHWTPGRAQEPQMSRESAGGTPADTGAPAPPPPSSTTTTTTTPPTSTTTTTLPQRGGYPGGQSDARAAVQKMLYANQSPADIAAAQPQLWAAAGYGGMEQVPRETLLDPAYAPTAAGTNSGFAANVQFDPSNLNAEGQTRFQALQQAHAAGQIDAAAARQQALQLQRDFPAARR